MDFKYDGIFPDALFLMAQNQFENSKIFYEEHKQELKDKFTVPLRQIAQAMSGRMLSLDDKMMSNPVRMVSRIRRDNRYTKDKSLYRDHLWIMFMRNKHQWFGYPCMWMSVEQDSWDYGVGMYFVDAKYLELFRKALLERPQEFIDAIKDIEKTDAKMYADYYKKKKPGNPIAEIEPYYNMKNFGFIVRRTDFETLQSDKVLHELDRDYEKFEKMYTFLRTVADERTML